MIAGSKSVSKSRKKSARIIEGRSWNWSWNQMNSTGWSRREPAEREAVEENHFCFLKKNQLQSTNTVGLITMIIIVIILSVNSDLLVTLEKLASESRRGCSEHLFGSWKVLLFSLTRDVESETDELKWMICSLVCIIATWPELILWHSASHFNHLAPIPIPKLNHINWSPLTLPTPPLLTPLICSSNNSLSHHQLTFIPLVRLTLAATLRSDWLLIQFDCSIHSICRLPFAFSSCSLAWNRDGKETEWMDCVKEKAFIGQELQAN